MTVIVAGGGIAGMTMALTCHQLDIPVIVHESVAQLEPLGVGINLQPNAVRELYDLGLREPLDEIGVQACLLYTSPSPRDATLSRMPSSA